MYNNKRVIKDGAPSGLGPLKQWTHTPNNIVAGEYNANTIKSMIDYIRPRGYKGTKRIIGMVIPGISYIYEFGRICMSHTDIMCWHSGGVQVGHEQPNCLK